MPSNPKKQLYTDIYTERRKQKICTINFEMELDIL